jgi:NDP-sugar pyrophosphorylase family protein
MIKNKVSDKNTMVDLNLSEKSVGIALAAGLGTRLRPLTSDRPKPLVPFCGVEILQLVINKLENVGLNDIGLNTHYLKESVHDFINQEIKNPSDKSKSYFVSVEKEQILGTAGCYPAFNSFRKNRSLITANGDVLSNTKLENLVAVHQDNNAVATMAVLDKPHKPDGVHIWVENQQIVHIGKDNGGFDNATPHGFACFQILEDRALQEIKENEYQELVPIYQNLIKGGEKVCAYIHKADWFDLGTHKDYFEAHKYVLSKFDHLNFENELDDFGIIESIRKKGFEFTFVKTGETKIIDKNIKCTGPVLIVGKLNNNHSLNEIELGPNTVIMNNVSITENVQISNSVILPDSVVNNDVENAILFKEHLISVG